MGKFITLREEFESETGAHRFADQQYIEWLERVIERQRVVKNCSTPDIGGCNYVKTSWDIRECFKQFRLDKKHHLGHGDIRLTMAHQEEICSLVERFYHC